MAAAHLMELDDSFKIQKAWSLSQFATHRQRSNPDPAATLWLILSFFFCFYISKTLKILQGNPKPLQTVTLGVGVCLQFFAELRYVFSLGVFTWTSRAAIKKITWILKFPKFQPNFMRLGVLSENIKFQGFIRYDGVKVQKKARNGDPELTI